MSYSFSVTGATKADVMEKVDAELNKVVASQPIHAEDRDGARNSAEDFLDLLPEPGETQEFHVSVSGSLGWTGTLGAADQALTSASVNVSASIVAKDAA